MRWPEIAPQAGHSLDPHVPQFLTECLNEFPTPLGVSQNNFHWFHLASIIGWRRALNLGLVLKQSCLSLFLRQEKKWEQKLFLSLRCLWSWPLFWRWSWKDQCSWCGFMEAVYSSEAGHPSLLICGALAAQMIASCPGWTYNSATARGKQTAPLW